VARIGVVVADLRRSALAQAGFWFASHALGFDRVTRMDGVTSLRRGFTAASLSRLLDPLGVNATIERRPGSRLVATWNKGPASGPSSRKAAKQIKNGEHSLGLYESLDPGRPEDNGVRHPRQAATPETDSAHAPPHADR